MLVTRPQERGRCDGSRTNAKEYSNARDGASIEDARRTYPRGIHHMTEGCSNHQPKAMMLRNPLGEFPVNSGCAIALLH